MNETACPKCAKPVSPAANVCPSCKQLVRTLGRAKPLRAKPELPSGPPTPETLDELKRIKEWTAEGRKIRPVFSIKTIVGLCITLVLLAAAYPALKSNPDSVVLLVFIGIISGMCTLVSGINDLMLVRVRALSSPEDLATYFFRCLKNRRYGAAMDAVADPAGSAEWRKGFPRDWKDRIGGAMVGRAFVKETQDLPGDMRYLRLQVELRTRSTTGFLLLGVLGSILFAKTQMLELRKLAVLRQGRWFWVNGFSNGVDDRRLMRALRGTPEGEAGLPGDSEEGRTPEHQQDLQG